MLRGGAKADVEGVPSEERNTVRGGGGGPLGDERRSPTWFTSGGEVALEALPGSSLGATGGGALRGVPNVSEDGKKLADPSSPEATCTLLVVGGKEGRGAGRSGEANDTRAGLEEDEADDRGDGKVAPLPLLLL